MQIKLFFLSCFFCFLTSFHSLTAQDNSRIPDVFSLTGYENELDELFSTYQTPLLSVCEDQLDSTFSIWKNMLQEMESFAESKQFQKSFKEQLELKGLKLWLTVFFDKKGKIDHLAFELFPNSRNVKLTTLQQFFKLFIENYQAPVSHSAPFFHDGQAGFPVQPILLDDKK